MTPRRICTSIAYDLDNQRAITEFCTRKGVTISLEDFAKNGNILIEYYGDPPQRAHIVCYSTHPFLMKSSNTISDRYNIK